MILVMNDHQMVLIRLMCSPLSLNPGDALLCCNPHAHTPCSTEHVDGQVRRFCGELLRVCVYVCVRCDSVCLCEQSCWVGLMWHRNKRLADGFGGIANNTNTHPFLHIESG